jgi:hypothetical protein
MISEEQAEETGLGQMYAPGGPALPIYLNRWGGTYYAGFDNSGTNSSSIVDSGSSV